MQATGVSMAEMSHAGVPCKGTLPLLAARGMFHRQMPQAYMKPKPKRRRGSPVSSRPMRRLSPAPVSLSPMTLPLIRKCVPRLRDALRRGLPQGPGPSVVTFTLGKTAPAAITSAR